MSKPSKLWKERMLADIDALGNSVLTPLELRKLFADRKSQWDAPRTATIGSARGILVRNRKLRTFSIKSIREMEEGKSSKAFTRHLTGQPSEFLVALSLQKGSYISHGSAVRVLGMVGEPSSPVYANREQSPKPPPQGTLSQEAIDRAFQNKPRVSLHRFDYRGVQIVLLSGKNTGNLGVEERVLAGSERIRVTGIERTLIDITVRPAYSGGPSAILEAFKHFISQVSIDVLTSILRRLNYVYPYHQLLGFYMQRAGFPTKSLEGLRRIGLRHDFYVAHRIKDPRYDSDWKVHYPKGL
jgi:hypothetical protein